MNLNMNYLEKTTGTYYYLHRQLLFGIKRKPTESDLNFGKDLIKSLNLKKLNDEV